MKLMLLAASLFAALSTARAESPADNGWIYLGAAHNSRHCQRMASQGGYAYYQYGPAVVNGVYVLNACLASVGGTSSPSGKKWFVVTPYHTDEKAVADCAAQVEETLFDVTCFLQKNMPKFECKARGTAKQSISDVPCVRSVSGPHNDCVLCGE